MTCPGLNLASSDKYNWYLPDGFKESQRTVCSACCEKYDITGTFKRLGPSNCDSYFYRNWADNGIFNFSIWSDNKQVLHPALRDPSVPNTASVDLPTNGYFHLLISGYGLKTGQVFTWGLYTVDNVLIEESPPNVYYLATALTNGIYYINDGAAAVPNLLTKDSSVVVIKIHLYKLKKKDPFTMVGDNGTVTVTSEGIFTDANQVKILPGYASADTHDIHMYTYFEPFTIAPVQYTVKLVCNNAINQTETVKKINLLQKIKFLENCNTVSAELAQLALKMKELKEKESELQAQIHLL
jgi:hypothetical protein